MPAINRRLRFLLGLLGLGTVALLGACSGKSDCTKACKHASGCFPSGAAPSCTLSAQCSTVEQCQADCILAAACPAIAGTDLAGRAALDACVRTCGGSTTDGGKLDLPPSFDLSASDHLRLDTHLLFADSRPKDTLPDPDTHAAGAVGKFCHALVAGGQNIWMELRLGSGASQLTLTAYTGGCNTSVGSPCISIPVGSVPYDLRYDSQSLETGTVTIAAGKEYVFLAEASAEAGTVSVWAGALNPGYYCQTVDPFAP